MSTYAIGDIQGCFTTFRRLLDQIHFDPAQDTLWLVGDLVNRGPQSLETLRFIRDLGPAALTVLGNHDLYLLMVAFGQIQKRNKDDTLQAILSAPDRDELLHWLRHQPLCHAEQGHCLVHAGLLPDWTAEEAVRLGQEVSNALQGPDYPSFLSQLWGSEPDHWETDLQGIPRLRLIVNVMTRMRFCTREGRLNFKAKGPLAKAAADLIPWFDLPNRQWADHTLVVGHWSALGLRMDPQLLALDTGCLWGGQLTAVRLTDRSLTQVPCAPGDQVAKDF